MLDNGVLEKASWSMFPLRSKYVQEAVNVKNCLQETKPGRPRLKKAPTTFAKYNTDHHRSTTICLRLESCAGWSTSLEEWISLQRCRLVLTTWFFFEYWRWGDMVSLVWKQESWATLLLFVVRAQVRDTMFETKSGTVSSYESSGLSLLQYNNTFLPFFRQFLSFFR